MTTDSTFRDSFADRDSEADWLAVRYVLGELPAGDAERLESRLAEDQSAREAVARAVQVVQALAVAPLPAVSSRTPRPSMRRALIATLGTLAAVVLLAFVAWRSDVADDRSPLVIADDVDPARLVVLWSDSAQTLGGILEPESEGSPAAEAESNLLPPDWMLAAVEHEALVDAIEPPLDADSELIERN